MHNRNRCFKRRDRCFALSQNNSTSRLRLHRMSGSPVHLVAHCKSLSGCREIGNGVGIPDRYLLESDQHFASLRSTPKSGPTCAKLFNSRKSNLRREPYLFAVGSACWSGRTRGVLRVADSSGVNREVLYLPRRRQDFQRVARRCTGSPDPRGRQWRGDCAGRCGSKSAAVGNPLCGPRPGDAAEATPTG